MSITSIIFLFCFLPISLATYYIVPDKSKEYVLLFISLFFYACGSTEYLILFVLAISMTVGIGRLLAHISIEHKCIRCLLLILGITLNASILIYYKYFGATLYILNNIFNLDILIPQGVLPLGISFFTFKAISYLSDIYSNKVIVENTPIVHDALYLSFFAQIQSGPISRYNEMQEHQFSFSHFSDGTFRFLIGFSKKILLADVLSKITNEIFSSEFSSFTMGFAWLGAISYSLELYFDFAGYSDMAIGITKMFGYDCHENFIYPYMTESISKFWRRWHISLSEWFRDYIYIPLGGSKNSQRWRTYFNLLIVWLLTGIWHGYHKNFIIWGLGYFVLISFERITGLPERLTSRLAKLLYRGFSLFCIMVEWVIFRADSLTNGVNYIKRLFIPNINPLTHSRTLLLLQEYGLFIIVGIILCFPIFPYLEKKVSDNIKYKLVFNCITFCIVIISFVLALSFVISGQNNPFAYANF